MGVDNEYCNERSDALLDVLSDYIAVLKANILNYALDIEMLLKDGRVDDAVRRVRELIIYLTT
jgi:hypothetical protein